MLDAGGLDPTVINGGIINAYGTNARLGAGDWMVVEADESDGTFVKLPATIAVVTNIDPEHLDFYGTFEAEQHAFEAFVGNIPFYGFAALCVDHPVVQSLIPKLAERRVVTYGLSPQADVRAVNIDMGREGARYDVVLTDRHAETSRTVSGLRLPMLGQPNVKNSPAVVAGARGMGLTAEGLNGAVSHRQRTLQSKEDRPTKKKHLPAMHVAFQPSSQRSSRGMVVHIPRRRPAILRIQASRYSGGEQILHTVHNLLPHSYAQQCR